MAPLFVFFFFFFVFKGGSDTCVGNDSDVCWKASPDEKQHGEKHVGRHCFLMITRISEETAYQDTELHLLVDLRLPINVAELFFSDKHTRKFCIQCMTSSSAD